MCDERTQILRRLFFSFSVAVAVAVLATNALAMPLCADDGGQVEKKGSVDDKVYLLDCPADENVWKLPPKGLHWQKLHQILDEKARQLTKVTNRSKVDQSMYLDIEGLRLYASSRECLKTFKKLPAESSERITSGYLIRNLLGRRRAETGIEPDRIPVRGSTGKKFGTSGMVLIKDGEYIRPGHYYTSQSAKLGERLGDKYRVRVSSFYIDKYKVTNEEYCRFLNDGNPGYWNSAIWSNIKRDANGQFSVDADKAKWPVIAINWYQAVGYAEWAGKRLPTEAEWEFAAGGSAGRKFPWGNENPDETRGTFVGDYTPVDAHPAGATPDGVFDLAGNCAEWCADFYDAAYYETAPPNAVMIDPRGPAEGNSQNGYRRMFKGFCRGPNTPEFFECKKRHARPPLLTAAIGIRCVRGATANRRGQTGEGADGKRRPSVEAAARSGDQPQRAVNYTKLARSLARYPNNPVIKVGEKGEWNDQTLGCFTVLDAGELFYFYSGGAQYGKPKNIGMATSEDGVKWTYYEENPLFPGAMPYAIKVHDTFRLYHPSGPQGLQLRTSKDGFNWSEPRKVFRGVADPCVVRVAEDKFHLYFCDGRRKTRNGRKGWEFHNYVATAPDGIKWSNDRKRVLPLGPEGSWDSDAHAGPCVLKLADGFHMWYLGSGTTYMEKIVWRIGHATSPDGLNWTKSGKEPVLDVGNPEDWDGGTFMSFDIIFRDGKFLFWYAAAPTGHEDETKMTIQIGHGASR